MDDPNVFPLSAISGVGPHRAEIFADNGIHTVQDLLEYYPFRYDDLTTKTPQTAEDGTRVTFTAQVWGEPIIHHYGRRKSRLTCRLIADDQWVQAVWFNQAFIKNRLVQGTALSVTGKWDALRRQLTISQYEFIDSTVVKSSYEEQLAPVYSVLGTIKPRVIRRYIQKALDEFGYKIHDLLPESVQMDQELNKAEAIIQIHNPTSSDKLSQARGYLAFEELLVFQLKIQAAAWRRKRDQQGVAQKLDRDRVRGFVRSLPFKLTASQKLAVRDILQDMAAALPMNRLLQGDVGSGKTVVAAAAAFACATAKNQIVFMAPTEILAEQHLLTLDQWFKPFSITVEILTGGLKHNVRQNILNRLRLGEIDIIIGTHALLQDDVSFHKLGLVIMDEQHRFGVRQRHVLRQKGWQPDVLTMTATPIPRTMTLTIFGDLDVTTLTEKPAGRLAIKTYLVSSDTWPRIEGFICKEIEEGRQVYVICPLVEASEKLDAENAASWQVKLKNRFPNSEVGLLHGRMPSDQKDQVMRRFASGDMKVLVSTTVIEVGVDVPNATLMIIQDADRFGLAQLHQLRGRVGRGKHASYCILIADPKTDIGKERLRVMTSTEDGFYIAQKDLELRGPGEVFGLRQSGAMQFKLANLALDTDLLLKAREVAAKLIMEDTFWTSPSYEALRRASELQLVTDQRE